MSNQNATTDYGLNTPNPNNNLISPNNQPTQPQTQPQPQIQPQTQPQFQPQTQPAYIVPNVVSLQQPPPPSLHTVSRPQSEPPCCPCSCYCF